MDDVAAAAGVGKGTLFRRFGDRIGLIRALYEERGLRLQDALTVSPTRPAAEQAAELLRAMLRFKLDNRVLTLALESAGGGSPYRNEAYDHWHALLAGLVAEARGPQAADYLAHALLAAVRSDLVSPPARMARSAVARGAERTCRLRARRRRSIRAPAGPPR